MRKILGLDLGTNSIGWAVVNESENENGDRNLIGIDSAGCRIIPMDAGVMGEFDRGNSVSQTAARTGFRGTRRLRERFLLRRERLHRVLNILGALPEHYAKQIDYFGKFIDHSEPKIEWYRSTDGSHAFLFQDSFHEMLQIFRNVHPGIYSNKNVPADWTIYYLRKKALSQKISKQELAWILLNFNQKRGYYQLRGEDNDNDIDTGKREEYQKLNILSVEDSGDRKGNSVWYNIKLSNGLIYKRTSETPLDWEGKEKEFIISYGVDKDGNIKKDKEGTPKYSIRVPKEDDWNLIKKRTEADIKSSGKTVGEYIFDEILHIPNQKIIGKLVRTIERKHYKDELNAILKEQMKYHPELNDEDLYEKCICNLYKNNEAYRDSIEKRDFKYLLCDDIIFYQRPLKSQKHLINDCPYEKRYFINPVTKERQEAGIKCICRSHPLFQEFRLWQFISNLRIYENDGSNRDVTELFFNSKEDWVCLYNWLNNRKEIDQGTFIKDYLKCKKIGNELPYRWNYVEDKKYPCNKTRHSIVSKLTKNEANSLSNELIAKIWHLLYSVKTQQEIESVFNSEHNRKGVASELRSILSEESIGKLKSIHFEEEDYASYSEKAIKKLLPLMRTGSLWSYNDIDEKTKERINKILTGEFDPNISDRVRNKVINLSSESDFQGLPLWLACYVVYGTHSESKNTQKWYSPSDIDIFLKDFKQHSLRNPIVEQVVTETLRTVRDIWKQCGKIDEIHIELGREMRSTKEQRIRMTKRNSENENANERIKTLLREFLNPEFEIEGVRPYSPSQFEILKLYEEDVLSNVSNDDKEFNDSIRPIIQNLANVDSSKKPTKAEIIRYKLWLDQKYCSPYTGQPIPLNKLFTHEYEIEHIIPQSRYFDDSLNNKVICESEVNKLKDRLLGMEFIMKHHGTIVQLGYGETRTILSVDEYEKFVKSHFASNRKKLQNLLLEDIPDGFIERQMNDTRYISKYIKSLLSCIVREEIAPGEYETEETSKNLISCNGTITTKLKQDWGVNNVWNKIILPRFIRMNEICKCDGFTSVNSEGHIIPGIPDEFSKGFNKKRIDHRHHAMDAIVIACTTRSHVQLLNNEAAKSDNTALRHQLSHKLRRYEKVCINGKERLVAKEFIQPWQSFTKDVYNALQNIIVSFKQNLRIINKTSNKYWSYSTVNGIKQKIQKEQVNNPDWWAIRKSMHKDTVFGKVTLRKIKDVRLHTALQQPDMIVDKDLKKQIKQLLALGYDEKRIKKYFSKDDNKDIWSEVAADKIAMYYYTNDTFATRKPLDNSFNEKKIKEQVTDTGIQKILLAHLGNNDNDPNTAFSPDGIALLNDNIVALNGGRFHTPIYKVRIYEAGNKFNIGKTGNKSSKYVEADKGTNLYFAVYNNSDDMRSFETIPLDVAIERMKNGLSPAPETNEKGDKLLFTLSPNDLVYIPIGQETGKELNKHNIYKIVSFTKGRLYAVPYACSQPIVDKVEYTKLNKIELTKEKEIIIPIKVDRLGNIISNNCLSL